MFGLVFSITDAMVNVALGSLFSGFSSSIWEINQGTNAYVIGSSNKCRKIKQGKEAGTKGDGTLEIIIQEVFLEVVTFQ